MFVHIGAAFFLDGFHGSIQEQERLVYFLKEDLKKVEQLLFFFIWGGFVGVSYCM